MRFRWRTDSPPDERGVGITRQRVNRKLAYSGRGASDRATHDQALASVLSVVPGQLERRAEDLADEVPGGGRLTTADLTFCRTALVERSRYWIWSFNEPEGGNPA